MRRQAAIAAVLMTCLGIVLGATVFRTDIAGAGGAVNAASGPTSPSSWFHAAKFDLASGTGCKVAAEPPAGKALVVRQVRVDTFSDPTPGASQNVTLFLGTSSSCGTTVADVNPATIGQDIITFDPGLGVPAGSTLNVLVGGSVQAEVYTDGYLVPPKQVPATTVSIEGLTGKQQQ
jgi:hypothetical protein